MPEARRWLVCDAMTSGGLLAAVPQARAHELPGVVIAQDGHARIAGIVGALVAHQHSWVGVRRR